VTRRTQQVESVLQRAISTLLAEKISDPRIMGMISVTEVSVSEDMRNATVRVSVLPQEYARRSLQGLRHARGYIHERLCRRVRMRTVPQLEFQLDESLKKQAEIFQAIRQGLEREQDREKGPEADAEES